MTMNHGAMLAVVVVVMTCVLSVISTIDPCSEETYIRVDDVTRDVTYGDGYACDRSIKYAYYRFMLNGSDAVMPTSCPQHGSCGTADPVWMNLDGGAPPGPNQTRLVGACANNGRESCFLQWMLAVHNCGSFFVYQLTPVPGCYLRYCVEKA